MSSTAVSAPAMADDEKSTNQILQALDALSHTLYRARANLRATSLALPRSAADGDDAGAAGAAGAEAARPRSRRLSLMAPFRSRPKVSKNENGDDDDEGDNVAPLKSQPGFAAVTAEAAAAADGEKKGRIWSWGPIRALSHIGMRRMGCLFSVEVVAAQGLPPSMNGLRLAVAVRKKEARDGAVQTMPARVQQGAADFDETLFIRCHLYGSGGGSTGNKTLRFEPRPFQLSLLAVDAPELDFGRSTVDLSLFAKEFTDKCQQGECIRQWDMVFSLTGKAMGGELVVKLAFQSIDDGGAGLYSQPAAEPDRTSSSSSSSLTSFTRKLRKSSFSMMLTPKMTRTAPSLTTPKMGVTSPDLQGIDSFKLDDEATTVAEAKEEQHKEAPEQETEKQHKEATETEEQQKEAPEQEMEERQKETPEQETEEQHKEAPEPETKVQQKEAPKQETKLQQEEASEHEMEEQHKEAPEEQQKELEQETKGTQAHDDLEMLDKGIETQEEKDERKEEATDNEVVKEVLEPRAMPNDVSDAAAESVEPSPQEEGTMLDDANKEEAMGGGGNGRAAKSPPAPIRWPAIAIVVAPVAVLVSKTLARR